MFRLLTSWHTLHSSENGNQSQCNQEVPHSVFGKFLDESNKETLCQYDGDGMEPN